ncbi:MAG: pirin family protein [Chitinophagaceae bacterium]
MERTIRLITRGNLDEMGPAMLIRWALPNQEISYISPFILLHHSQPAAVDPGADHIGVPEHPHKGFITFTYLLEGAIEHRDSRGGHGVIEKGGAQWMMTGSGIQHEEMIGKEFSKKGGTLELLQLWINIPAKHKMDTPYYLIIPAQDIPIILGEDQKSFLKVLAGSWKEKSSAISTFTDLLIYHIQLQPGAFLELKDLSDHFNLFAYLSGSEMVIGSARTLAQGGDTVLFSNNGESLRLENPGKDQVADLFLFGGEPITEPMAARGPFVMNTEEEIRTSYQEYQTGKFGRVIHP